jgi:ABC-type Fe3+-siderophore transport system permease subunit
VTDNQTGDINISKIPVSGWGGLGLVAMAVVMSFAQPQLRWLTVIALLGGAAIGLTLIAARNPRARHHAAIGGIILALAVVVAAFVYFR